MKRLLLITGLLLCCATIVQAGPGSFVTRWVTNNGSITLPVNNTGPTYTYNVTWTNLTTAGVGNGSVTGHVGNYTITGLTNGNTYELEITGNFPGFYFNYGLEVDKIRSIERWGSVVWTNMAHAFQGCQWMVCNATDSPDVSLVTDMSYAFYWARSFNADLSGWDVDQVTTMRYMFYNAAVFNGDISGWSVGNVTNMERMFFFAEAFNRNLNSWDVSKVVNMGYMFENARTFNGDISSWNVSNVTNMSTMFRQAWAFNQNIGGWNVSKVTNMSSMFTFATVFNQDLNSWDVSNVTTMSDMFDKARAFNGNITSWDVSKVVNMSGMFSQADAFNRDISGWNVSNVVDMSFMFDRAEVFNQNLNSWNVSKVTTLNNTFHQAPLFNGDISSWNVSNVTVMASTFEGATSFNRDISSWDVSKATTMYSMFGSALAFSGDLSSWNVGNVTDMSYMFYNADSFNDDISSWNVSKVTKMPGMFGYAQVFNQPLNTWNVANVTDMREMFSSAIAFNQDLNSWNTSKVTNMVSMFYGASVFNQDLNNWNVGIVTLMNDMFHDATVFNGNISTWNVANVTDMSYMFQNTHAFNGNIGSWNVGKVTKMRAMFAEALAFNQPLNAWDVSKVTQMDYMFVDAPVFNQDLNNWNIASVTDLRYIFAGATSFNGNVTTWNVSNITTLSGVFFGASAFNRDLSGWNVGKVTNTYRMFENAIAFNQDLSSWNVSKMTNMDNMFTGATSFNQSLEPWNISFVTTMKLMLNGTALSIANYEATLRGWARLDAGETKIPLNVQLGAAGLYYTTVGQVDRSALIGTTYKWIITGDMLVGGPVLPTITGFTPTSGLEGAAVTITGTNFSTTPSGNTIKFNGVDATVISSTATSITTTVPVGAETGKITITVGANTATSATDFTVLCDDPEITGLDRLEGVEGDVLTITGTGFKLTPSENEIDFNGIPAVVTASSATSITTSVPVGAITGPITVNTGCSSHTTDYDFTILCASFPTITSFTPASGPEGTSITITGTNFSTTVEDNRVYFNGVEAVVTAASLTSLTADVPSGVSTGPITVNNGCASTSSTSDFVFDCGPAPGIGFFTPTSGVAGTTVTITGENFSTTVSDNRVYFNGTSASVTSSSANTLVVQVPPGASPGPIEVQVACNSTASDTDFDFIAILSITSQPADAEICEGMNASFSIFATGTSNISFRWQYSPDGNVAYENLSDSPGIAGSASATLTISPGSFMSNGFFRCAVSGDFAPTLESTAARLVTNPKPADPSTIPASRCGEGPVTLTATGGIDGQYKWYTAQTGGNAIDGAINSSYTTSALSVTTEYYVVNSTNKCESSRIPVRATITPLPTSPVVTGASACPGSRLTLNASGGSDGQYKWYTSATGLTVLPGEVNHSYTTPVISETTTYYVAINATCESQRTPVTATIVSDGCAPEIDPATLSTQVEGMIVIDLKPLISTVGTLEVNSIKVTAGPASGAVTTIEDGVLTINYSGVNFGGLESITIEACNTNGLCGQQDFIIEVEGDVVVYNGISPNDDGKNETFILQFIDALPRTKTNKVHIYNRWGTEVFSISDYDNKTRVFSGRTNDGNKLPSGTYFYKIHFPLQAKTVTGYLSVRH